MSDGGKKISVGRILMLAACGILGSRKSRRSFRDEEVRQLLTERFPGEKVSFRKAGGGRWKCWFDDLPEAAFPVRVARRGGDPVPAFHFCLSCGDGEAIWRYYVERYRKEAGCLDAWDIAKLETGETYLTLAYACVQDIRRGTEQLEAFYRWGARQPHWDRVFRQKDACIFCVFQGGPLPGVSPLNHKYYTRPRESPDRLLERCAGVLREYYAYYLLPSPDFSQEELLAYAAEKWNWEAMRGAPKDVYRGDERLPPGMFSGVWIYGQSNRWPEVSIGGLYIMAVRLGFDVRGTPEDFAFTGVDGRNYKFSYQFFRDIEVSQYGGRKAVKRVWHYLREEDAIAPETWKIANRGRVMPCVEISREVEEEMLGIRLEYK